MTATNIHQFTNRKTRPCPMCKKPSAQAFHPFCCKRCADVDLGKWLGGSYAVPAVEPADDFGAEAAENGENVSLRSGDESSW
jgi:uncharacterized protein